MSKYRVPEVAQILKWKMAVAASNKDMHKVAKCSNYPIVSKKTKVIHFTLFLKFSMQAPKNTETQPRDGGKKPQISRAYEKPD
jgi:hypothetical protein